MAMNTDIRRFAFGAIEYSAFCHGKHVAALLASRAYRCAATEFATKSVPGMENHMRRVHAKRHGVPS
jgi:hypothetical protein